AVSFHGLIFQPADPLDDPADQSNFYDMWETISLGKDKILLPTRLEVKLAKLLEATPGRGGTFMEWLVDASMKANPGGNRDMGPHMAPPVLYLEGIKVQTPWLYNFLKDPARLRHTTVLRMPQFNMSNDEAEKLANYFAAVDEAPFPYLDVPQREPEYLAS